VENSSGSTQHIEASFMFMLILVSSTFSMVELNLARAIILLKMRGDMVWC